MITIWLGLIGLSGFLAVTLGAFGAHGLKGKISDSLLSAFQTGIQYHMFHTLAMLALLIFIYQLAQAPKALWLDNYCWLLGTLLFSGSLYALAMGGPNWLGPITPLGGLLLISGWLCLAVGAWQLRV